MRKILHTISVYITTVSLLTSVVATAVFADTKITVEGNGSSSDNDVTIHSSHQVDVTQTNFQEVSTTVHSSDNTGGNDNSNNTDGTSSITTGNASSDITVGVSGPKNTAKLPKCGCKDDTMIDTLGNGSFSETDLNIKQNTHSDIDQMNSSDVDTFIKTHNTSGKNKNDLNTGAGSDTLTGDASSFVDIQVLAPSNMVH